MARAVTRRCLREWGLDAVSDDVVLAVSECAANACVHGAAPAGLRLALSSGPSGHVLTCEVSDAGSRLPGLASGCGTAPDGAESGRGLGIVAGLAAEVWVRPAGTGKTVGFRFDLPGAAA